VPGNRILFAPRHRILFHPALHTEPARRHPVLGLVLDQRRRQSGARFHRPADSADVDDSVDGRQRVSAARQLRQSHRRLDVGLPCVRVRGARRVRHGQRVRAAQVGSAQAAARAATCTTSHVHDHIHDRHHSSTTTDQH